MTTRNFLALIFLISAITLHLRADETPSPRPNILFIAIDDLRPELGTYGTEVSSPHIDQLAASGMRFDRAYCQQAVCGASRLSLMGGRYPTDTHEQTFHVDGWRKRHPDLLTMNKHFSDQGYRTIGLGKIYHGTSGPGVDRKNWTRWIEVGAPEYALPENNAMADAVLAAKKVGDTKDPPKGPTTEMADVPDDTYSDGKRAAKACSLLKEFSASKDQPFFLAVGFTKPHLPFVAPKKYWDLYERESFEMPANQSIPPGYPENAANLPAYEMQKYSDFEGERPTDFSDELNRKLLHGYAAATSYVDACVGRVLQSLQESGLAGNTIVVLWGDHGWKLGDHASWTKHTNFECDTRVPLIIRDPRLKGGLSTPRLVELIDLYPTLCDLTGLPIPKHCQGRSFRKLLSDPTAGHRWTAYSSYPAGPLMGHSLRFGNYRYTEWHSKKTGEMEAQVLTNLVADPGEETNLAQKAELAEVVQEVADRLKKRLAQAGKPKRVAVATEGSPIPLRTAPEFRRQTIDGFGGSIAFWGTHADDKSLEIALNELNTSIIRVQGEVSPKGTVDHNREILQRAMKINPQLEVILTFWQPRSSDHLNVDYWQDIIEVNGSSQYSLKPDMEDAWADELVSRTQQYLDWGINVTVVAVQNESNWSSIGAQTCRWEPGRLTRFIAAKVKPRLIAAGLGALEIAAPDLAYIGPNASEATRFLPTITDPSVSICAYHMYDSYRHGEQGRLSTLIENAKAMGALHKEHFPGKRLWMTETSGAQWNSDQWHTYGWSPELSEHGKAIQAARYMHMTLADAGANAFLWWGLIYSEAPERETNEKQRQKHRDEGLVLVKEPLTDGFHPFLERTKKFHAFRQHSAFIQPGYQRLEVNSPNALQLSAYLSPNESTLVVVGINATDQAQPLKLVPPKGMMLAQIHQTDRQRNCVSVGADSNLPGKSVRTYVFQK